MKKTVKRVLSSLLAIVMLLTTIPFAGIKLGDVFAPKASAASIPSDAAAFNGHSYKVYSDSMTWSEANSLCIAQGGHLATITSNSENKFLYSLVSYGSKCTYWIGLSDSMSEGSFYWITGESFSYSAWDIGQPDDNQDNQGEDYVEVFIKNGSLVWNDNRNDGALTHPIEHTLSYHGYICEWDFVAEKKCTISAELTLENDAYYYKDGMLFDKNGNSVSVVKGTLNVKNTTTGDNAENAENVSTSFETTKGFKVVENAFPIGTIAPGETKTVTVTLAPDTSCDWENDATLKVQSLTANVSASNADSVKAEKMFSVTPIKSKLEYEVKLDCDEYKFINGNLYSPENKRFECITATLKVKNCLEDGSQPIMNPDLSSRLKIEDVKFQFSFTDNEESNKELFFENHQWKHEILTTVNYGESQEYKVKVYPDAVVLNENLKGYSSGNNSRALFCDVIFKDGSKDELENNITFKYQLNNRKDFFAFTNSTEHFGKMFYDFTINFLSIVKNTDRDLYSKMLFNGFCKWGGSCLGMAAMVSAFNKGMISPSNFGASTVYSLNSPKNNSNLKDCINFLFMLQYTEDFKNNIENGNSQSQFVNKLINSIKKIPETNFCPVLCIRNSEKGGKHAVTCYNVVDDGNNYVVYLYDPNSFEPEKIIINKKTSAFSYGEYNSICGVIDYGDIRFTDIEHYIPDFFGDSTVAAQAPSDVNNGKTEVMAGFNGKITVEDSNGKYATIRQDGTVEGTLPVKPEQSYGDSLEETNSFFSFTIDDSGNTDYTFSCTGTEYSVYVSRGDFSAFTVIKNNNGSKVNLSVNDVKIEKNIDSECTLFMASADMYKKFDFYCVCLNSKDSTNVSMKLKNSGVLVESDNLADINAEVEKRYNDTVITDTISFKDANTDSVILYQNGDNSNPVIYKEYTNAKVNSISVGNLDLKYKDTAKLNPVITADSGVKYTVEYKSSNTNIATVDSNGNVYGAKKWGKGTATITCTVTDEYGNQVSDTANVTVGFAWWQWIIGIVLFGWIWY